jgi:hypothetical protein
VAAVPLSKSSKEIGNEPWPKRIQKNSQVFLNSDQPKYRHFPRYKTDKKLPCGFPPKKQNPRKMGSNFRKSTSNGATQDSREYLDLLEVEPSSRQIQQKSQVFLNSDQPKYDDIPRSKNGPKTTSRVLFQEKLPNKKRSQMHEIGATNQHSAKSG